jgi:probable phosphoglycerate mutase
MVRHGETEWNREKRIQGHSDSPLTALGRAQAKQVGERLAMEHVDAIYSSDSGRAMQTAGIIAQHLNHLEIIPEPRLREIYVGTWEGLYISELAERFPEEQAAYLKDRTGARGGGESLAQLRQRAWEAISDIAATNPGKTTVAVAHGGTIQAAAGHVLGIPLERSRSLRGMENCNMTWIEWEEDGWVQVKRYNVPAFGVAPLGDVEDELGEAQ